MLQIGNYEKNIEGVNKIPTIPQSTAEKYIIAAAKRAVAGILEDKAIN